MFCYEIFLFTLICRAKQTLDEHLSSFVDAKTYMKPLALGAAENKMQFMNDIQQAYRILNVGVSGSRKLEKTQVAF